MKNEKQVRIINDDIEEYVEAYSSIEDELLKELHRETYLTVLNPNMISGHLQGLFLEMVSCMINPYRILEIGTYTGYSTICLSKGLRPGGIIDTIEKNEELVDIINKYIKKAGISDRVNLYIGDANKLIGEKLQNEYDLVFIDGDKKEYIDYYEKSIKYLKQGGFMLVDNVLWYGNVLGKDELLDKESKSIKEFSEMVKNDNRVKQIILPLRDGLTVIRKIN